jgi:hypothetical protein
VNRRLLAAILLLSACAPVTSASPSPTTTAPTVTSQIPAASSPLPSPSAAPSPALPGPPDARLLPAVRVDDAIFPIMTTLRLKLAVVDEAVVSAARFAVERYLNNIDLYRDGRSPVLPITGPFLNAVSAALRESATPGVRRAFLLESLTVDRHVQKPWGTHAYVDVTVTIVDRAVDGSAPDQRETGKLRLSGDRLMVTDAWDFEHDRWFNGFDSLPLAQVRNGVKEAVSQYLWFESWIGGSADNAQFATSPFQREHALRIAATDRRQTVSQLFEEVSASIERFETIDGIWSGVATARLSGTVVTTNPAGHVDRTPFERHVRVFLLGNWIPEVVDEQLPFRDWASGGDLALDQIDVNRA